MKIVPRKTAPPRTPTIRRHNPAETAYQRFRHCLRREFGFTCAFCLLHEADFSRDGYTEGTRQFWIEHITPQSESDELRNVYSNCAFACHFCNQTRKAKAVETATGDLLNPTTAAWADHFVATEDLLVPVDDDDDAPVYAHGV
ncbi:MAG: HNH endonuclease [Planctomycetota bacterium]|nr:HNH endonuclease [Planctomycetota bacterium]